MKQMLCKEDEKIIIYSHQKTSEREYSIELKGLKQRLIALEIITVILVIGLIVDKPGPVADAYFRVRAGFWAVMSIVVFAATLVELKSIPREPKNKDGFQKIDSIRNKRIYMICFMYFLFVIKLMLLRGKNVDSKSFICFCVVTIAFSIIAVRKYVGLREKKCLLLVIPMIIVCVMATININLACSIIDMRTGLIVDKIKYELSRGPATYKLLVNDGDITKWYEAYGNVYEMTEIGDPVDLIRHKSCFGVTITEVYRKNEWQQY